MDFKPPEDLEKKALMVKHLADAGIAVDPAWVERTFGVKTLQNRAPKSE